MRGTGIVLCGAEQGRGADTANSNTVPKLARSVKRAVPVDGESMKMSHRLFELFAGFAMFTAHGDSAGVLHGEVPGASVLRHSG